MIDQAVIDLAQSIVSVRTNSQPKVARLLKPTEKLPSPWQAILGALIHVRTGDFKKALPLAKAAVAAFDADAPLDLTEVFASSADGGTWWWADPLNGKTNDRSTKGALVRQRDRSVFAAFLCHHRNFEGQAKFKKHGALALGAARVSLESGLDEPIVYCNLVGWLPRKEIAAAVKYGATGIERAVAQGNTLAVFALSALIANREAERGDRKAALRALATAGRLAKTTDQRKYLHDRCYLWSLRPLLQTPEFESALTGQAPK